MDPRSVIVDLFFLVAILPYVTFRYAPFCGAVVTLDNNGYRGLVIAIHKNVPDNPHLVTRIKHIFTNASQHLHLSTRHRAYLEDVTIIVPSTWKQAPDYVSIQSGDHFSRAEVRVDTPNPLYGHSPYTEQPGGCGDPGKFIHFTPEFLLGTIGRYNISSAHNSNSESEYDSGAGQGETISLFGDPDRVFVHEWAHLRYGTFDEHGNPGDPSYPEFYLDSQNMIRPTSCTNNVRGWLRNAAGETCTLGVNGLPNSDCIFYPEQSSPFDNMLIPGRPSVMYMPSLNTADGFCDDDEGPRKHNPKAPNRHNFLCHGRSTWDVITKHVDFLGGRNPANVNVKTVPRFRVIQPKKTQKSTFVMVLDHSGSMAGRAMKLQNAAASRFIMFQVADQSSVGIVTFSGDAQILAKMTQITNSTRGELLKIILSMEATGGTAIGLGLKKALQLLMESGEPTEGAMIMLLTDGEENVEPNVADVLPSLIQAKVIINTVAFGKDASRTLEDLVTKTGGRGFFYEGDNVSHKMLDTAFVETAATHADVELQPIEIVSRNHELRANENVSSHFLIDKELGKDTLFLVSYNVMVTQSSPEPINVLLRSPAGRQYSSASPEYTSDRNIQSITIKIPNAEAGTWQYWINSTFSQTLDVTTLVKSEPLDVKDQPIRVNSWIDGVEITFPKYVKVYAEVKKGYNPVVNATIIATIGRPQGDQWTMFLHDNGIGADTKKGDGVYSGYFSQFVGSGRYSVEAAVANDGKARIKIKGINGASTAPRLRLLPKSLKGNDEAEIPQSSFLPTELHTPTDQEIAAEEERLRKIESDDFHPIGQFERFTSAGAFSVKDWTDEDRIPPNRVSDLQVTYVNLRQRWLQLEWTSPGDDMDVGNANLTEVRFHHDPDILMLSFSQAYAVTELLEGDLRPPTANEKHVIRITIPSANVTTTTAFSHLHFAVRTQDESGNTGEVSNLAFADFNDRRRIPQESTVNNGLIWGSVGAVVGLLILILICVVVLRARRSKKQDQMTLSESAKTSPRVLQNDRHQFV